MKDNNMIRFAFLKCHCGGGQVQMWDFHRAYPQIPENQSEPPWSSFQQDLSFENIKLCKIHNSKI